MGRNFWIEFDVYIIIRSSLIHLQGFYLLEQLPMFVKITPFLYTNRMNLPCLKPSLSRLALISKGFLDLKKMLLLIKIESQSPPRSLLLLTNCNNVLKRNRLFIRPQVLSSGSYQLNPFVKIFSESLHHDDSDRMIQTL